MPGSTLTSARHKYTLTKNETFRQIATAGGIVLISAVVTGGGSSAALRVYDSAAGVGEDSPSSNGFLLSANAGESTPYCPSRPVLMQNGLYIELEQGADFNGEAFITYDVT